jgi:3-oxoacyl-[acyl-carrier protein] reductase
VLTYHQAKSDAEQLAKEIGDRALVVHHTLDDADSARSLVDAALAWTGRIDVLVNNAVHWGDAPSPDRPFETVPDEVWLQMIHTNIDGHLRMTRAVVPVMRQRRWGRLVNISSIAATHGMPDAEYYATAKAALNGFSRTAALGLGRDGDILSNVVMPSVTRTDTNVAIIEAVGHHYSGLSPIGRLLDAGEVARAVVFLGSAANTGITGQAIMVNGGASTAAIA